MQDTRYKTQIHNFRDKKKTREKRMKKQSKESIELRERKKRKEGMSLICRGVCNTPLIFSYEGDEGPSPVTFYFTFLI